MKRTGIHIRIVETINHVLAKAVRLGLPTFQTFAVTEAGRTLRPNPLEIEQYQALRAQHFANTYLHGSYWINLARDQQRSYRTFERELEIAKQLHFTHFVIHPGASENKLKKEEGLLTLAKNLNRVLTPELPLKILIENTAHGGRSLGSNFKDFAIILNEIRYPEKIGICLDTSHAYAYGYDLRQTAEFIEMLKATVSLNKIELIHLNDTTEKLGAKIDRHHAPGHGNIGMTALKELIQHPQLQQASVIMELPKLSEADELQVLQDVVNW